VAVPPNKGKQPVRGKAAPNLQEGEEQWAELMRRDHGNKGADWYARGVKTVEVSFRGRSCS
jgi:hypothetical protein